MKTQKEIEEYRNSVAHYVQKGRAKRCHCIDCLCNKIALAVLEWVLGNRESLQGQLDAYNEAAARDKL